MKLLCFLLSILAVFNAAGQTISGYVFFEEKNEPVPYASVALKSQLDSSIISGGITLMDGKYSFNGISNGDYIIEVRHMGYLPATTNVNILEKTTIVNSDTLFLRIESKALEEVVIKADRLQGKELVDRTVYEVPEEVASLSNTGYELLRLIPQVQIDFQNNVTLNGSTNFIVEVDGKQRDKEFLARLEPGDISSIEIITNPSGKYEGNIDGVLSIKLKREARMGISGNINTFLKPINKPTGYGSASVDYGLGDVTFYITAFTFFQYLNLYPENVNKYLLQDSTNRSTGKGELGVNSTSVNGGMDWYINDYNHLSVNIKTQPINQNIETANRTENIKAANVLQYFNSDNTNLMHSNELSASVFYKKSYKKPVKEFTAEATGYNFKMKDDNDYDEVYYTPMDERLFENNRAEKNNNKREYYQLKLNYVLPVGFASKIETGYQIYYQKINYYFENELTLFDFPDTVQTDRFKYNELRNALYAGYTMNVKKIGFNAVLRVEHSKNFMDNSDDSQYFTFLPSANLQYKFSTSKNIKLTYNRRINRPGIYDLNPAQKITGEYTLTEGNPYLEPSLKDRLQLTFTWNFDKNYLSPYIYYLYLSEQRDNITSIVESPISNTSTFLSKPFNIRTGHEQGGGLNALLWYMNINASVYQGVFDEFNSNGIVVPSYNYSSFRIQTSAFYKFDKIKLTSFVFAQYNGVSIQSQTKTYSMPVYGLGSQKEMGNHNLGFFWLLPLREKVNFRKTITETPMLYARSDIGFDISYYIQIMYSYKFSKGKSVKKIKPKIDVESDSKSEGIGR